MLQKFVLISFQGGVEDRFRFQSNGIGFYLANRNFRTLYFNEWIARLCFKLIGFLAAMRFCHDWLDLMGDLGAMSCVIRDFLHMKASKVSINSLQGTFVC